MANCSINVRNRFDLFKSLTSVDLNVFNKEVHFFHAKSPLCLNIDFLDLL